jgi:Flp pilus assembly protein TadD
MGNGGDLMKGRAGRPGSRRAVRSALVASVLALGLAGCQTAGSPPAQTGSIGTSGVITPSDLTPEQALAAIQHWGSAYTSNEKDKVTALNYAAALRAAGETSQAVAVMRKAAIYHASDREVIAAFGKALAANGQFEEALATVRRAQRDDNPDWQLLATEGGILDSLGEHDKARALYRQGLVLAPGEPQLLNNLGLSYLLTNELDQAEEVLRQAAASSKATLKIRQNLELVLAMKAKGTVAANLPDAAPDTDETADSELWPEPGRQQDVWKELAESG